MSTTNAPAPSEKSTSAGPILSPVEARILGALIEKEFSTPDLYPLTLNSLVNACNQRSNRAPFMVLGAAEVETALESLRLKRLVVLFAGADARVPKFRQTLDSQYPVEPVGKALLAELLLRGPQTSAELRARAERLTAMPDAVEIEAILTELAARPNGALVRRLARQPGQKEARWAQLLTGETIASDQEPEPLTVTYTLPPEIERRLTDLESEVTRLRAELAALRSALGES